MKTLQVTVKVPKLHPAQETVKEQSKRFNVLCNGRRWGKTYMAVELIMERVIEGYPVGIFVPTFDFAEDLWEELKERTEPILKYRNEAKYVMQFITGGSVKVWSLEKKRAGRGRKYKRVIIDEAAFAKDLEESWNRAIRPTLADMEGDAWFLSTPQGTDNYFYTLYEAEKKPDNHNWKSFRMPSITNPYLKESELHEIKTQLDSLTFRQEFEAEFVTFNGMSFAYSFNPEIHISEEAEYNPEERIIYLSFDFNLDPGTCLLSHQYGQGFIDVFEEVHVENGSIYDVLNVLKGKIPAGHVVYITGDASGYKREAATFDLINMYDIITKELRVHWDFNHAPIKNPSVKLTRVILNSILERGKFRIHPRCKHTIKDLELCNVDKHGDIDKTNKERSHHLDTVRYQVATFNANFINFVIKEEGNE